MKTFKRLSIAMSAAACLASGCSTHVSRGISPEGVADEMIFPDAEDATMKGGIFPNPESLRLVKSGVTKDQLYYLLGRPHFREGFAGVREWDYLFHFREAGDRVRTCQFKVIYDRDYLARSFHWLPADCAGVLAEPVASPRPATAPPVPVPPPSMPAPTPAPSGSYSLSGDAVFAFGKSGLDGLTPEGRSALARVAAELGGAAHRRVEVYAHTDRIGSEAANQALSQARANTVRDYLVSRGMSPAAITAIGMGEGSPLRDCADTLPRSELIACLAPNRRVEIRAGGTP